MSTELCCGTFAQFYFAHPFQRFLYRQELIWSPSKATSGACDFLKNLPYGLREKAFVALNRANYDPYLVSDPAQPGYFNNTPTADWSTWASDQSFADEFHKQILLSKKCFPLVASALKKDFSFIIWYYYHKYKPSERYQTLKNLMSDIRTEANRNQDVCTICDDGGGELPLPLRCLFSGSHHSFRCLFRSALL